MQFFNLDEALKIPLAVNKLVLSNQQLTSVPSIIWRAFPNLEILDLSQNQIKTIPNAISKLQKLLRLNLSSNRIVRLPTVFLSLKVTSLDLSNNRIKELQELPPLLETLDISHNKLKIFPEGLENCPSLIHLNLSHNRLEGLPSFSDYFPLLQYLNVSHAGLKDIGNLPPKLYAFLATKNKLNSLPKNCLSLKHLQRLDISSNPVDLQLKEGNHLQNISYLDVRKTKIKWKNILYLIDHLPNLQMSFGGLTSSQQLRLSAFLNVISKSNIHLSNKAIFQILSQSDKETIKEEAMMCCLTQPVHIDLKAAAFKLYLDRHQLSLGRTIKSKCFSIIGDTYFNKELLISRLEQQKAVYCENIEEADILVFGHQEWPLNTLKKSLNSVSEFQLIKWLDTKEGRYLTHLRDKNKIENIQRMIMSKDMATFDLGISLLRSWGTPKAVTAPLLKKWLNSPVVLRKKWEDVLFSYLPESIKILISSATKTQISYTKGWEKKLWLIVSTYQKE